MSRRRPAGRARPDPADEEAQLGEVVLVLDGGDPADAGPDQPGGERAGGGGATFDQGVADVEGQRVPAEQRGQLADGRKQTAADGHQRRHHREHRHAGEQAAAGGQHPEHRLAGERVEKARHLRVVLVVVEDNQRAAARPQPPPHGRQALRARVEAPQPDAEPDGQHVDQGPVIPGADAQPFDPRPDSRAAPDARAPRPASICRCRRTHQREARMHAGAADGGERVQLGGTAVKRARSGGERHANPDRAI